MRFWLSDGASVAADRASIDGRGDAVHRRVMLTPLTSDEIARALASLPGWSLKLNALTRSFNLGSFREAMCFMGRIAFEAEELNHHPEWTNVYDRVVIRLNTHDVGGVVTARDVALALRIQRIAEKGAGISSLAAERG